VNFSESDAGMCNPCLLDPQFQVKFQGEKQEALVLSFKVRAPCFVLKANFKALKGDLMARYHTLGNLPERAVDGSCEDGGWPAEAAEHRPF
jgi:hypothetical protein